MNLYKKILITLLFLSSSISYSQWAPQNISTWNTLLDVQFLNEHVGYISDDKGKIYKTTDRGLNWSRKYSDSKELFFISLSFVDETNGFVISDSTVLSLKYTSGNVLLKNFEVFVGNNLKDIQMLNSQLGWIVGTEGKIYKTVDGGLNWTKKNSNTDLDLWSVHFIDENVGYTAGLNIILKTIDGGESWSPSFEKDTYNFNRSFKSVFFSDTTNGWAVGQEWESEDGIIYHTSDAGNTWVKQNSEVTGFRLQSVHFYNDSIGFACGGEGTILKTTNGGLTWENQKKGTAHFLRSIYAVDSSKVYAVGVNGRIISTLKPILQWQITSQNEVDEIGKSKPTMIIGNLNIVDSYHDSTSITDLSPLSTINTVYGNLGIGQMSSELQNLNGLNGITYIEGSLSIGSNRYLDNVDELENLEYVGNNIDLSYNTKLQNVNSLNNIKTVNGRLLITDCDSLINLNGLNDISFIRGDLGLYGNENLENLNSFSNLKTIGGSINIHSNPSLENIDSLDGITSLNSILSISRNNKLTNIDGLQNLISIGGYIHFEKNSSLNNLDALSNTNTIRGDLTIKDNNSLISFCGLFNVLNQNGLDGEYKVSNNLINPTIEEILNSGACESSIAITSKLDTIHYLQSGETFQITWESENINLVNLEYSIDAGKNWISIAKNLNAWDGVFYWKVPNTPSIFCKLKISDSNNPSKYFIAPRWQYTNTDSEEICFTIFESNKWEKVLSPTNKNLTDIKFLDKNNGIAWGNEVLISTNDGGKIWQLVSEFEANKVSFGDALNGWKINSDIDSNYVLKTEDGGNTWGKIFSTSNKGWNYMNGYLADISFFDRNNGMLIENQDQDDFDHINYRYKTKDGGKTWEVTAKREYENWNPGSITSINYLADSIYWGRKAHNSFDFGFDGDSYFYISDSMKIGTPFEEWYSARSAWFLKNTNLAWFSDVYTGEYIYHRLGKYENEEWNILYDTYGRSFNQIYFENDQVGVLSGKQFLFDDLKAIITHNYVSMTQDGGNTWELQQFEEIDQSSNINSFFSSDDESFWAVGDSGTILKYSETITDIKNNEEVIISDYSLSQNYPNPFNPTTTIKYQIPNVATDFSQRISLKIYDVIGREVKTLVDEPKTTGSYEVNFDASLLPSGIYFYRLTAGNFVETKKMILLK